MLLCPADTSKDQGLVPLLPGGPSTWLTVAVALGTCTRFGPLSPLFVLQGPGFSHAARGQQTSTHDSEDDGPLVHVNEIRQYTGKNQTLEILPHIPQTCFQAVQISGRHTGGAVTSERPGGGS